MTVTGFDVVSSKTGFSIFVYLFKFLNCSRKLICSVCPEVRVKGTLNCSNWILAVVFASVVGVIRMYASKFLRSRFRKKATIKCFPEWSWECPVDRKKDIHILVIHFIKKNYSSTTNVIFKNSVLITKNNKINSFHTCCSDN